MLLVALSLTDFLAWAESPRGLGQSALGAWVVALWLAVSPVVLALKVGNLRRRGARSWPLVIAAWAIIAIGAVAQWEAGRSWPEILLRPVTLALMLVITGPDGFRSFAKAVRGVLRPPLRIALWALDSSRSPYRKKLSGVIVLAGYLSWVAGRFFDAAFADVTAYFTSISTSDDVWSCFYVPPKLSSQVGTPLWLHVAFSATLLVLVLWAFGLLVATRVLLCLYLGVVVVWNACQAARLGGVSAYTASFSGVDDVWQHIYLPPKLSGQVGTPPWLHVAFPATLLILVLMVFLQLCLWVLSRFVEQAGSRNTEWR
ncbi:hypothetical protein [Nonomuraea sp. NPDC005692]|uniref:hypothetical protein n=1 Tax=Nonomuraea sp. NPDC005692 TaxID=3157168 RepID=UPI0033FB49E5